MTVCLLAGCSSSSKTTATKPSATSHQASIAASTPTLGHATACRQIGTEQDKLSSALTALGNGNTSAVQIVTKLDPIRAAFERLAKVTSDPTIAGLLSAEAKGINKIETSGGSDTGVGTELSIDVTSLTSACEGHASTLQTVPKDLAIPGETTTR